ncbi:MAG: acetyl-CoA carboxylase biotin carboxyl carrier protein, partial [Bacteroidota bacterium]|nr:acetyl-CoA carboxylase biotin carboxyl carrier protein [Bacteroidota bacterium]
FVAKSGATEVDLEIDNVKISIKSPAKKRRGQGSEVTTIIQEAPTQVVAAPTSTVPTPAAPVQVSTPATENSSENASSDESNYITIKASMIGTFYRSSSPEIPPFVNVGDSIKKGDTICIIEAMKLFNEIESEVSGKIVKVLVDDTTPIEFDQPLFLVDPS